MREYCRIDAYVPFRVRFVPVEERGDLRSKVSSVPAFGTMETLPDLEDSALAEYLHILNAKLDAVLRIISFQESNGFALPSTLVNISGSGMAFASVQPYTTGDVLEMTFMLPGVSDALYCVYGEVVRWEEPAHERLNTHVKFTVVDEDIRNRIVKFVFEKQRQFLIEQRRH